MMEFLLTFSVLGQLLRARHMFIIAYRVVQTLGHCIWLLISLERLNKKRNLELEHVHAIFNIQISQFTDVYRLNETYEYQLISFSVYCFQNPTRDIVTH